MVVSFGLNLPNGKESFRKYNETIRLSTVQPLWRNILLGICCTAVSSLCALFVSLLLGTYAFDPTFLFNTPDADTRSMGWGIFIAALKSGIWKEIAFRGVILTLLLRKYSPKKAIVIDGVAFGLIHLINIIGHIGSEDFFFFLPLVLNQVIYTTLLGIFLLICSLKLILFSHI